MTQKASIFSLMRGGISRGVYLNRNNLPRDSDKLRRVLVSMLRSQHRLNIDGIG